jgi:hypothetical protein
MLGDDGKSWSVEIEGTLAERRLHLGAALFQLQADFLHLPQSATARKRRASYEALLGQGSKIVLTIVAK